MLGSLFRADTVSEGQGFIATMFGLYVPSAIPVSIGYYLSLKNVIIILAAVFFSTPACKMPFNSKQLSGRLIYDVLLVGTLIFSISVLAASTYNPFIYFRF